MSYDMCTLSLSMYVSLLSACGMFSLQHREKIKANAENIEKLKVGTIGKCFCLLNIRDSI